MKAPGFIFQTVQPPQTVFGLPPMMMMLSIVIIGAMDFFVMVFMGGSLALLVLLVGIAFSFLIIWRLRRRDPHCETLMFLPSVRLKKQQVRYLIAGQPPETGPKKTANKKVGKKAGKKK